MEVEKIRNFPYATAALIGAACFLVITSVFPPDSFYKEELRHLTGIQISDHDLVVLEKDSTFPDLQGNYYLRALFHTENVDIKAKTIEAGMREIPCNSGNQVASQAPTNGIHPAACWSSEELSESGSYSLTLFSDGKSFELTNYH